jgi:hypothetical protein
LWFLRGYKVNKVIAQSNDYNIKEILMPKKTRRQASRSGAFISPPKAAEFNPNYAHIKRDLKRIGILAASFFVILVALSFFLR